MSEVSTDKKLKGKDLITIGIFSAILCHQLCLYASGRYSPCSLDADAWLYRCVLQAFPLC